jgi:hypothetical protein
MSKYDPYIEANKAEKALLEYAVDVGMTESQYKKFQDLLEKFREAMYDYGYDYGREYHSENW